MLTDAERATLRDGALAKELIAEEPWQAFVRAVEEVKKVMVSRALQKGETDFEKGAVVGIELVMAAPTNTIEEREAILAREARLGETVDEDEAPAKEKAP